MRPVGPRLTTHAPFDSLDSGAVARRAPGRPIGIGMTHRFENHDLVTEHASQMIDVTDDVRQVVERSQVQNGMAVVYSPHTTCSILINELEDGFMADFADL